MKNIRNELKKFASQKAQSSGVQGITFRELGNSMNIKSSSVFYHFGSKDKLLFEIAQDYKEEFLSALQEIERKNESVLNKILALVNMFEAPFHKKSFCLCGMLAAECNELDEQTIAVLNSYFDEIEKWIFNVITRDLKLSSRQGKMYASIIIAALEGGLMLDRVKGKLKHLQAIKEWLKILFETMI